MYVRSCKKVYERRSAANDDEVGGSRARSSASGASNKALSVPGERLVAMSDAMWAVPQVVKDGQEAVPQ